MWGRAGRRWWGLGLRVGLILAWLRVNGAGGEVFLPGSRSGATPPAREICLEPLEQWLADRGRADILVDFEGALSEQQFRARVGGLQCAIVGNSGALLRPPLYGGHIDAADVVLRFNQAPVHGYEQYVGQKTTLRMLNRVWSWRYSYSRSGTHIARKWAAALPRERNVTLIATRTDPPVFTKLLRVHAAEHLGVRGVKLNRRVTRVAQDYVRDFRACARKARGDRYDGGTSPSSGLIAITLLSGLCHSIFVYGVGGEWGRGGVPYQYFEFLDTQQEAGNPTHSFPAEKALLSNLARHGAIRWCTSRGCLGAWENPKALTKLQAAERARAVGRPRDAEAGTSKAKGDKSVWQQHPIWNDKPTLSV